MKKLSIRNVLECAVTWMLGLILAMIVFSVIVLIMHGMTTEYWGISTGVIGFVAGFMLCAIGGES